MPAWTSPAVDDSQAAVDKRVNEIVPRETGESEHDWSMRCRDYVMDYVRTQTAKVPNKDWARRIVEREARGEPVSLHALLSAQEALGPVRQREPGDDDEILDRLIDQYGAAPL